MLLAEIRQKDEEPYESFLARLQKAMEHMMPSSEASDMFIKQLDFENAKIHTARILLGPLEGLKSCKVS